MTTRLLSRAIVISVGVFHLFITCGSTTASSMQYYYDNLDRLTKVVYEDGSSIQYTYDAEGNRLTKQTTASAPAGTGQIATDLPERIESSTGAGSSDGEASPPK